MVQHHEHDALIGSFSHLANLPREKEALHALKKIASVVKPIMRARGWKVGQLAEFYPNENNLLGLNVNHGQRILLRLRYAGDKTQFLPIEQVTDTMLHELAHIVHGPHDGKFYALWDQLRDEHEGLLMKGYTGEGFLSTGHKLGGTRRVPVHEARRLARAAAEKRAVLNKGSGQRLGGQRIQPGQHPRQVIAAAVERRTKLDKGCGNTNHNDKEIQAISDTATKNGFKTQAEEDAANEAAIAQALWELVQEDEKQKYGSSYVPPSINNPTGSQGGISTPAQSGPSSAAPPAISQRTRPAHPQPATPPAIPSSESASKSGVSKEKPALSDPGAPLPASGWTCTICTLHNPATFLVCDACGTERSEETTRRLAEEEWARKRPRTSTNATSDSKLLTHSRMVSFRNSSTGASDKPATEPAGPAYWECSRCGNVSHRQWWTCSNCGNMKENSR